MAAVGLPAGRRDKLDKLKELKPKSLEQKDTKELYGLA
jgi:hypothetical protein